METKFVLQILFLNSNLASNIILTMNRKFAFLNAHILSSLLFLFCINSFLFSQKKEIDVRNVSTSEFPKVRGDLWIRNPEGIKTKTISFYENQKKIKVEFGDIKKVDSVAKNKTIAPMPRRAAGVTFNFSASGSTIGIDAPAVMPNKHSTNQPTV